MQNNLAAIGRSGFLAALLLVGTATPASAAPTQQSTSSITGLVFAMEASPDDITSEIVAHDLATGATRVLTHNDVQDSQPAATRDGAKVAFIRAAAPGSSCCPGPGDLWLMNKDGTGQQQLTHLAAPMTNPAWSPDGSTIAVAISGDNPRLTFLSRTGTVIRSWPGRYDHPSYSPDGKKLVVTLPSSATSLFDLAVLNASTGAVVQWIRRNTGLIEEFPSWSPDGRYILYNRCCAPGDWSLRLVTPQGATVRSFGAGYTGAFSPDGSLVLNASKGSVFNVQSGAFVAHLFPQFSLSFPSWSAGSLPPS